MPITAPIESLAQQVQQLHQQILGGVRQVVVGLDNVVEELLIALVVGGHVLLEGVPGTAKTTLCKTFAQLAGIDFHRIQFTPDLLPADVTGTYVFDRRTNDFTLRKGPIFCEVLLADELNRAPAKTQSALLEAMQEHQVTIEGTTLPLPRPFMVLATQNPVEQEGVYRLPEAQLDRFLLRVQVSYPDRDAELLMLDIHSRPTATVDAVTSGEQLLAIQRQLNQVYASPEIRAYIVDLARHSREHPELILGASPRAVINVLKAAAGRAILYGRSYVTHDDVQKVLPSVLGHRLILRPEAEIEGRQIEQILQEIVGQVPVMSPSTGHPRG
ncbi:MAG: MoxR family ATPase [Pirellulales bacterium]